MRTLDFGARREPRQGKRAASLAVAVLVHALALLVVADFGMARFAAGRDRQAVPARFFVDVYLPALAQRPASLPAAAAAAVKSAPVAASAPRIAAHSAVEVVILPREVPDTVRLQLPASHAEAPASGASEPVAAGEDAPGGAASGPAGVRDEASKVIGIETIGTRSATYSFPALGNQVAGARAQVFKVDIGAYSDIELAIVNHVIEQIRLRYPDEITWESKNRGGIVRLSMRPEDHAALVSFLRVELFGKKKSTTY